MRVRGAGGGRSRGWGRGPTSVSPLCGVSVFSDRERCGMPGSPWAIRGVWCRNAGDSTAEPARRGDFGWLLAGGVSRLACGGSSAGASPGEGAPGVGVGLQGRARGRRNAHGTFSSFPAEMSTGRDVPVRRMCLFIPWEALAVCSEG